MDDFQASDCLFVCLFVCLFWNFFTVQSKGGSVISTAIALQSCSLLVVKKGVKKEAWFSKATGYSLCSQ